MKSMEGDKSELNDFMSNLGVKAEPKKNEPTGNLDDFFSDLGTNYSNKKNNDLDILKSFENTPSKKIKKKNKKKKKDTNDSTSNDLDIFADDW